MCGHKQTGIGKISKITVVDSNDVVNHWLMTGAINIPTILSDKTLCYVTPEVEADCNCNGFGDMWWTDKCTYFSSIDIYIYR